MNCSSNAPMTGKGSVSSGTPLAGVFLSLAEGGFVGDSIVDGPGLRCAIFVQGCPHGCPGCHNPQTHPFEGGHSITADALLQRIHRYPLCRGVTFSGGEPFCQAAPLAALGKALKSEGYNLAAYTGYTFEALLQGGEEQKQLLDTLDILIDGPFMQNRLDLTLRFRGSSNQRILDVPKSLSVNEAVWTRNSKWTG